MKSKNTPTTAKATTVALAAAKSAKATAEAAMSAKVKADAEAAKAAATAQAKAEIAEAAKATMNAKVREMVEASTDSKMDRLAILACYSHPDDAVAAKAEVVAGFAKADKDDAAAWFTGMFAGYWDMARAVRFTAKESIKPTPKPATTGKPAKATGKTKAVKPVTDDDDEEDDKDGEENE